MVKLSKASREVARGNYSITVEDPSKLEEVQTTLRNFNALVREMNRINNVTNDFVSSVSHEFKTPLTAIEGYAMLLQDTGLTQAERDEYLDKILYTRTASPRSSATSSCSQSSRISRFPTSAARSASMSSCGRPL